MEKKIISEQFDVVVIGAGPAGMMAAISAAQKGARVALVDKKEDPGRKLLMSGGGRCNLTQDEQDLVQLSQKYKNGKFLLSALKNFSPSKVRSFFEKKGVKTKVEKNGRVFPISDKAIDVFNVLMSLAKENGITFLFGSQIVDFVVEKNLITKIKLKKRELDAKKVVISTGGKSYPATGSTGDGFEWAVKMGHKLIEPQAALVPIEVQEEWINELQGVSANSVGLSVFQNNKKQFSDTGDLMFAHFGLSGPLALNISSKIGKLAENGKVKLAVDFKPYLSFEQLDEIVQKDFERNGDKKLSNCLADLFSPKLLDFLLGYSGLDCEKHAAKISRKERQHLINIFKNLEMNFGNLFGFERAMVTSGGISTKEIDSKTMQSKIINNLYFAGEIIDVDGPTGGYNLQMCWSTGRMAGENASKFPLT